MVGEVYLCSHDSDGEPILLKNFKGAKISKFCGGYHKAFILEESTNGQARIHSLHPPEFDDYDYTFTEKNLEDLVVSQKEIDSSLKARYDHKKELQNLGKMNGAGLENSENDNIQIKEETGYSIKEREYGKHELSAVREVEGENPEKIVSEDGYQEDRYDRDNASRESPDNYYVQEEDNNNEQERLTRHIEDDVVIGGVSQTEVATNIYSAFDGKGSICDLRSGRNHIVLLNLEGEVYSYGYGEYGVMGRGMDVFSRAPMKINNLKNQKITKVTSGYQHCLALNNVGDVYSWGRGFEGQLGLRFIDVTSSTNSGDKPLEDNDNQDIHEEEPEDNSSIDKLIVKSRTKAEPLTEKPLRTPVQLECSSFPRVLRFFTKMRYNNTVVNRMKGKVDQDNIQMVMKERPKKEQSLDEILTCIPDDPSKPEYSSVTISDIECGAYHSLALTRAGDVYGWGDSGCGQLGIGRIPKVWIPMKIPIKEKVVQAAAGFAHSLIVTKEGFVYSFGLNHKYQLGFDDQKSRFKPERLQLDDNGVALKRIVKIACGDYNCFALSEYTVEGGEVDRDKGKVYAWGSGILGMKEIGVLTRPKIIKGVVGDRNISDIYVNNGNVILFTPLKITSMKPSCGPSCGGTIFSLLGVGLCDMNGRQRIRFTYGENDSVVVEQTLNYDESTNSYNSQTPNFETDGNFDPSVWPTEAKVSISLDGETWFDSNSTFLIYSSRMKILNISPKFASIEGGLEMNIELITDQKTMKKFTTVSVGFQATEMDVRTDAQKQKAKEEEKASKKDEVKVLNPVDLPLNSPELERPDWIYFEGEVKENYVVLSVPPITKLKKGSLYYNIDVSMNGQQFLGTPSFFRYYQVQVEKIEPDNTVRGGGTKIVISGNGFIDSLQKKIRLVNSKTERMIDVKWEKVEEYYYFFTPPISWLSGREDDLNDHEIDELMKEKIDVFLTISGKDWITVGSYIYYEPRMKYMLPGPLPDKTTTEEHIRENWTKGEPIAKPFEGLNEKEAEKKRVELEKRLKEDLADIENIFRKPGSLVYIEGEEFIRRESILARLAYKDQNWDVKVVYKNSARLGFEVPLIEGPPEGVHDFSVNLSFDGGQNFSYHGLKLKYYCFNKETPDIERNKLMDAELKNAKKAAKK